MRPYLLTSLLLLTTGMVAGVPAFPADPILKLSPAAPRQGDALFVRLDVPAVREARVTWRERSYPLYREEGGWAGAVPISPDTPAGGHTLSVRYRREGEPVRLRRSVEVARVVYPVQRLKMAGSTAALYRYPGVKKEDAVISAAVRARSGRRLWSGDWTLPTRGRISTQFGVRRLRNGKPVGRHRGLDIAAPTGTPVKAPADGRVVLAGKYRKHGGTVVLDHGQGVTSLYIHLSAQSVQSGETVRRGQEIGKVGSTGVATGPHLHWSVYAHGVALEPLYFTRLSRRGAGP